MSAPASSPKKSRKPTAPKGPAAHPPTTVMVTSAVEALKDRTGSSLSAIKKYIAGNYKFDVEKKAHFVKRALKSLVEKGTLIQVKGTGASGSFKINVAAKKAAEKAAKKAVKKPVKKPVAKKAAKPKTTKPKKPKAKKATKATTPKKTKKPTTKKTKKSPAKKPAAKKPTRKTPVKKTPKKAAPAKKASKPKKK
ncbi:histone H1-like [Branchiostoma lanceolatum]|uniref:histone H1-like n=1 Tax=Branchiostoma lanceolatum TaxID=7740 RepID=UPI0034553016